MCYRHFNLHLFNSLFNLLRNMFSNSSSNNINSLPSIPYAPPPSTHQRNSCCCTWLWPSGLQFLKCYTRRDKYNLFIAAYLLGWLRVMWDEYNIIEQVLCHRSMMRAGIDRIYGAWSSQVKEQDISPTAD